MMLEIVKDKTEDIISLLENTGYYLINEQEKKQYQTLKKMMEVCSQNLIWHQN